MSWICPEKYKVNLPENINDKFLKELKGELSDKEARITLAQFLNANIGLTSEILTGGNVKMAPFQEILAKGVLRRNFSMFVLGRGCGKSLYVSENQQLIEKSMGRTDVLELSKNLDFSKGEHIAKIPELNLWNGVSWQPTN